MVNTICPTCNKTVNITSHGKYRKHYVNRDSTITECVTSGTLVENNNHNNRTSQQSQFSNGQRTQSQQSTIRTLLSLPTNNNNIQTIPTRSQIIPLNNQINQNSQLSNGPQIQLNQIISNLTINNMRSKKQNFKDWATKVGPLFERLHATKISNNDDNIIQTQIICRQILLCTPPFSQIDNNIDNTNDLEDLLTDPNTDDLYAVNTPTIVPTNNNKKFLIKQALHKGDISKATRLLQTCGGIKALDDDTIKLLKSKFPTDAVNNDNIPLNDLNFPESKSPLDFNDESTQIECLTYINSLKQGAAKSALGWSTDSIKEILHHYPLAINGFFSLLQLIVNGDLDEESRNLFYRGRGIALDQKDKVRPIVIQCPFHKVATHMLVQYFNNVSRTLCGNKQFANGVKAGAEILVHTTKLLMDMHPEWVIVTTDIKNAFNEINRNAIINQVNENVNGVLHYVHNFLHNSNDIYFNDKDNKLCLQINQSKIGEPQGAPLSSSLYCITQAPIIKELENEFNEITVLSFCDDNTFIGPFDQVVEALPVFRRKMLTINLQLQNTKSYLYSKNNSLTEEQINKCHEVGVTYIPTNQGLVIAGVPIGSDIYIESFLTNKVNEITNQLNIYLDVSSTQYSHKTCDTQTLFMIVRLCIVPQFIYLLRTCEPRHTKHIAKILDDRIYKFITQITRADNILQNSNDYKKVRARQLFNLPIREGGCGIHSLESMAGPAFVGSLAQCSHHIGGILQNLIVNNENIQNTFLLSTFQTYTDLLTEFKNTMPSAMFDDIDLPSIFESSKKGIQRIIYQKIQEQKRVEVERHLNDTVVVLGPEAPTTQQINDRATLIHHISNKNRYVSAFLHANPADTRLQMNNINFGTSINSRLLLCLLLPHHEYCKCGHKLDDHMLHPYSCVIPDRSRLNTLNNNNHKVLKNLYINIAKEFGPTSQNKIEILFNGTEPALSEFFENRNQNPINNNNDDNVNNSDNNDNLNNGNIPIANQRADFAIRNTITGKTFVGDAKFTCANGKTKPIHNQTNKCADSGELEKKRTYENNGWIITPTDQVELICPTMTQSGAPSKDTKKFINLLAAHESGPIQLIRKQKIYQKISCAIQTLRNDNIHMIRSSDFYTSAERLPIHPRPNSPVNINYRRFIAPPRTSNRDGSYGDMD